MNYHSKITQANDSNFITYDLALAATLLSLGFSIKSLGRSNSGKASFVFEDKESIKETIRAYWSDSLTVNPRVYFDSIKHIKTRIYSGSE